MLNVLEALPNGSRVAIIRLRSLGDCVLTTPALALLKRFRPDLDVSVVAEERFHDLFTGGADVDAVLPPRLGLLRRARPSLCLNLHGGTRSAWMTALSGARFRAGFRHFRYQQAYNVRIPRAQEILGVNRTVHTAEHLASAIFALGAPVTDIPRARLFAPGAGRPCVVIHPFATGPDKTWPAENFLAVARQLHLDTIFIGGPGDDLAFFREFPVLAGAPLSEIQSILASAVLFLGNDSGPAHIAAAFGVPSVVLFGSSNPAIWSPWRAPAEVLTSPEGIGGIRVEEVLSALTRLRVPA